MYIYIYSDQVGNERMDVEGMWNVCMMYVEKM